MQDKVIDLMRQVDKTITIYIIRMCLSVTLCSCKSDRAVESVISQSPMPYLESLLAEYDL